MNISLQQRERQVLGAALNKYDKGCKGAQGLLLALNLPQNHADQARVNVEAVKTRLASSAVDVDLPHEFRVCCRDALVFAVSKSTALETGQEELTIGTSEIQEWQHEVQALIRKLGEQMQLPPPVEGSGRKSPPKEREETTE